MNLGHLYYDMRGHELDSVNFKRMYPNRVHCAKYSKGALDVVTEFVGINHNPDPDGAPLIYETMLIDNEDEHIISSRWSSSQGESRKKHMSLSRSVRFGGAFLYDMVYRFTKLWRAL